MIRGQNLESLCNRRRLDDGKREDDQSDERIGQWGRGQRISGLSIRETDRQYPGLTSRGRSEHIWTGVGHDLKNIQAFIHQLEININTFHEGRRFYITCIIFIKTFNYRHF